MSTLEIRNLHVQVLLTDESVEPKETLKGVSLAISSDETHAMMDPNDSGKSTLSYTIVGHPRYKVTGGKILLDGENMLEVGVDEHARAGLFLAMQYPVKVTGVPMSNFPHPIATAVRGEAPELRHWAKEVRETMTDLEIDSSFPERSVSKGLSDGERKCHEILQLDLLKPKSAILDETDSDLDADALYVVSEGTNRYQNENGSDTLIITHYQCVLSYVKPDFVRIFHGGRLIISGDPEFADGSEKYGYEKYVNA